MNKHNAIVRGAVYRWVYIRNDIPEKRDSYYIQTFSNFHKKSEDEKELIMLETDLRIAERYAFSKKEDIKSYKTMWEGSLGTPLLEVGDKLYIEELDIEVTVNERIRHSNGSYIYKTNHKIKTVEDDKTKETRDKAHERYTEVQEIIETYKIKIDELKKRINDENIHQEDYYRDCMKRKKKWYEGWLG